MECINSVKIREKSNLLSGEYTFSEYRDTVSRIINNRRTH